MQLRYVSFVIYYFTCPSSSGKTNSNWKRSLFQLQLHSCEAALPLSDDWLLRYHSQRMIKMHFSPSLLRLRIFVYHLFWQHVEKKAVKIQHRKVSIFCWLIMDSKHLNPLKQPLPPSWSLFFRLWLFSCAITKSASQSIHSFVLILRGLQKWTDPVGLLWLSIELCILWLLIFITTVYILGVAMFWLIFPNLKLFFTCLNLMWWVRLI